MKSKYILTFALILFTYVAFSQDSVHNNNADSIKYKYLQKVNVIKSHNTMEENSRVQLKYTNPKIEYRPTRLGSSSPLYNTYEKNKRGAGAITTNPNKDAGFKANDTNQAEEYLLHSIDSSAKHHK